MSKVVDGLKTHLLSAESPSDKVTKFVVERVRVMLDQFCTQVTLDTLESVFDLLTLVMEGCTLN